jgi:hypothetical protein
MNLYIQLTHLSLYVESCKILEQTENQIILDYIIQWSNELKKELSLQEIPTYKNPNIIDSHDENNHYVSLCEKYNRFLTIVKNSQYIPIQPPLFTLKSMVDEIEKERIYSEKNIFLKNIPKFDFTESRLSEPGFNDRVKKQLEKELGAPPIVLSMAVIYHNNPLMWPLLFHEYGHTVFDDLKDHGLFVEGAFNEVNTVAEQNNVPKDSLSDWISEIYSDLFALRFYGTNYFFAFCFHIILSCNNDDLLQIDKKGKIKKSQHPPPYIRMKFLIEEYQKNQFSKDDITFNKFIEYLTPLVTELNKKMSSCDDEYVAHQAVFSEIYKVTRNLIKNSEFPVDFENIKKMEQKLQHKHPIGTSFKGNKTDYATKLRSGEKSFDIDTSNKINEIIYAGWSNLINHLFEKFYTDQNTYSLMDLTKNPKVNFTDDYIFFIRNITYSIETSVIVSSYKEA